MSKSQIPHLHGSAIASTLPDCSVFLPARLVRAIYDIDLSRHGLDEGDRERLLLFCYHIEKTRLDHLADYPEEDDFVDIPVKKVESILDTRKKRKALEALYSKRIVQCDQLCVNEIKSYGYRLGYKFRGDDDLTIVPMSKKGGKRISKSRFKVHGEYVKRLTDSVDIGIYKCLERLTVTDIENAEAAIEQRAAEREEIEKDGMSGHFMRSQYICLYRIAQGAKPKFTRDHEDRTYSELGLLCRGARGFVLGEGCKLGEADIRSSHLAILGAFYPDRSSDEACRYREDLLNVDIYEDIQQELPPYICGKPVDRKLVKGLLLEFLNCAKTDPTPERWLVGEAFCNRYPEIGRLIMDGKQKDHKELSRQLRLIEAMALRESLRRVWEANPEFFALPLHDAILTKSGEAEFVIPIMEQVFDEFLGFHPVIRPKA